MININVFSNEKAWSQRLRSKELFFYKICQAFPKKYKFLNKNVSLTLLLSNNKQLIEIMRQRVIKTKLKLPSWDYRIEKEMKIIFSL